MRKIISWKQNKKIIIILVLVLIFLLHAVNNYIIVEKDTTPLLVDMPGHFEKGVRFHSTLDQGFNVFVNNYLKHTHNYPPLFMLSSVPLYWLFGVSPDVGVMTNMFYLAILLLSVFFIGRKIANNTVGLLAAFIVSVFPSVFGFSRVYMLDFALTAMVALSICLLLYTDYFRNRLFSILFGVAFGLSFLTKYNAPIFVVGPLIAYFFYSFNIKKLFSKKGFVNYKKQLSNLGVALILTVLLSLIWAVPHLGGYIEMITYFSSQDLASEGGPLFYIHFLLNTMSLFFVIVFILSLILIILYFVRLRHKVPDSEKKTLLLLLLWFIIPFLFFTSFEISAASSRWVLPYISVFALLIGFGISKIRPIKLMEGIMLLIVLLGLLQFFLISYGFINQKESYTIYEFGLLSPHNDDWKVEAFFETIERTRDNKTSLFIFTTQPTHITSYLAVTGSSRGYAKGYDIYDLTMTARKGGISNLSSELLFFLQEADYILYTKQPQIENITSDLFKNISDITYKFLEQRNSELIKVNDFIFPDNTYVIMYKRVVYE